MFSGPVMNTEHSTNTQNETGGADAMSTDSVIRLVCLLWAGLGWEAGRRVKVKAERSILGGMDEVRL